MTSSLALKRRISHSCLLLPSQRRKIENFSAFQDVETLETDNIKDRPDTLFSRKEAILATSSAFQLDPRDVTGVLCTDGLPDTRIYPNEMSPSPTPSLVVDLPSSDSFDSDLSAFEDHFLALDDINNRTKWFQLSTAASDLYALQNYYDPSYLTSEIIALQYSTTKALAMLGSQHTMGHSRV
jgi:hypothetical protein